MFTNNTMKVVNINQTLFFKVYKINLHLAHFRKPFIQFVYLEVLLVCNSSNESLKILFQE